MGRLALWLCVLAAAAAALAGTEAVAPRGVAHGTAGSGLPRLTGARRALLLVPKNPARSQDRDRGLTNRLVRVRTTCAPQGLAG